MTMLLASGQSFAGVALRSSLADSHDISPCQPFSRNSRRWRVASPEFSALVNLTMSKPSARARARISSRASEVELGIVHHGRLARHAIAEQGTKGGPRFHAHVPFTHEGKLRPWNFSEV